MEKGERQSQTTEQLEQLDKGVSVLSESIGSLMDRLSKALTTPKLSGTGGEDKPDEELVPLATSICQLKCRVFGLNNDIQNILNRLEL